MTITWLTRSKIPQATAYYYQGQCREIKDESYESLISTIPNLQISTGHSKSYFSYDGYVHSVTIGSLQLGTTYCYSIGGELHRNISIISYTPSATTSGSQETIPVDYSNSWSKWISFKTANPRGDPTTFAAIADSGTYGNVFDVVKQISLDPQVDMLIHAGDLSYGKVEDKWDLFGEIFEKVTSKLPMMVIPGNWDVKEGAISPFLNRYPMPLPYTTPTSILNVKDGTTQIYYNSFYSYQYSYCYIIMMSAYDPYDSSSKQYHWLEKELIAANRQRDLYPWLIVSVHSPMYSSSSGHNGSDLIFRNEIEPLFQRYQVNLVLSGHDHGYERTYQVFDGDILSNHQSNYTSTIGTIHIVVGTGGADTDPWLPNESWTAHRESTSGYTKITAHKHTLQIIYNRINGTVGDQFIIRNLSDSSFTSSHSSILILFFILLTVVFPICAYSRFPTRLFSFFMSPVYFEKSNV
ncbi:Purple acid phosphatase [Tieghemostelium lacteum]|uniref:Purple acid phosphatase n=1 Tax=Tieghemostelium lacteum TaxID=361077 RepID=A0A152A6R2_TIELA|nr:Purple acid phosphatase [Tieghemostelium lacteum]|eukprot:KYR01805.1 Purple acid phosphatase [Tieghemostelium lacteum]